MLSLLLGGLAYALFLMIFVVSPLIGKVVLLVVNVIIPDPLPYIDEIVMVGSTVGNVLGWMMKFEKLFNFVATHKVLSIFIGVAIVITVKVFLF